MVYLTGEKQKGRSLSDRHDTRLYEIFAWPHVEVLKMKRAQVSDSFVLMLPLPAPARDTCRGMSRYVPV